MKTWWLKINVQPGVAIEYNVDVRSFLTWYMRQNNLTTETLYIAVGRRQLIFLAFIDGFVCTYVFCLSNQHLYKKMCGCTKRDMLFNIHYCIVMNPMPNASSVHSWQLAVLWMSLLPFSFHFYVWPCLHMQTHIKKTALEINFIHLDSKGCYCFFFFKTFLVISILFSTNSIYFIFLSFFCASNMFFINHVQKFKHPHR